MLESFVWAAARPDPTQLRDALARSYRGVRDEPGLAERAMGILLNLLRALLDLVRRALTNDGVSVGVTIAAWAIVGVLAFFAVMALRRLRLSPDRRARIVREREEIVDWHARAEAALRAGDHREAVRALYRALLAALDRRGVVPDAPSMTAGRARRVTRAARPDLALAVEGATGVYERVAYGLDTFGEPDLQRMREAEEAVLAR